MEPQPEGSDWKWLPEAPERLWNLHRRRWSDFPDEYDELFLELLGTTEPYEGNSPWGRNEIIARLDDAGFYAVADDVESEGVTAAVLLSHGWELEKRALSGLIPYENLPAKEQIQIMMGAYVYNNFFALHICEQVYKLTFFHRRGRPDEPEDTP